jgi:hypothetical protein
MKKWPRCSNLKKYLCRPNNSSTRLLFVSSTLASPMKGAFGKLTLAILALPLLTGDCYAQPMGGGGPGGGRKQHKAEKSAAQTPKVDEKAYNAAIKRLPDKPFDPWLHAR